MAIPPRTSRPGTYFITSATHNRRRLFQVDRHAQLFLDTIQHYRAKGHYKLHAFVIMPDHINLLLTPQTISLERAVGLIKGGFSHRLSSSQPIWQRSFTDHRIRNRVEFEIRRTYIHQNPVRANLVSSAEVYPWSSATSIAPD
ncbi:transposase [Tunturiibacter empetritectus]|uniref:Transposase n=1 Tax=Tunturiibacter lichenicola TaxID=2051959 RepID=A0A852VJD5_9BACT|nr:transposase [Edaphobacter lichenicola]NYF90544.1 putative transposase [Edaphobacter lichenicola]